MSELKRFSLAVLLILLAACQPPQAPIIEQPTSQILHLDITPASSWMLPAVNACAQELSGIQLTVRQIVTHSLDSAKADLLILSGSAQIEGVNAFEIGQTSLVVIVHADNPLEEISAQMLSDVFSGQIDLWSQVDASMPPEKIQVWLPLPGDEIWEALQDSLLNEKNPSRAAQIAPDPEAMLSAVSADPSAIGILPIGLLDQTVKFVRTDIEINMPILAVTQNQPAGLTHDFLLCLQAELQ